MTHSPPGRVELAVRRRTSFSSAMLSLVAMFVPLLASASLYLARIDIFHRTGFNLSHWRWPFMILAVIAFFNAVRHALRHDNAVRRKSELNLAEAEALAPANPGPLLELRLQVMERQRRDRWFFALVIFSSPVLLFILFYTAVHIGEEAADLFAIAGVRSIALLFLWSLIRSIAIGLMPLFQAIGQYLSSQQASRKDRRSAGT